MNQLIAILGVISAVGIMSFGIVAYSQDEVEIQQVVQKQWMSMSEVPLDVLAEHSEFAIVGEVVNVVPIEYTDPDRASEKEKAAAAGVILLEKEILSDVTILVEEDLFEKYDQKTITVRIPGGETPYQKTIADKSPKFNIGDKTIVLVGHGSSYSISDQHYTVIGLEQGTFSQNIEVKNQIKSLTRD